MTETKSTTPAAAHDAYVAARHSAQAAVVDLARAAELLAGTPEGAEVEALLEQVAALRDHLGECAECLA